MTAFRPWCVLALSSLPLIAQNRADDLIQRGVAVRSIDPADTDFADLEPLAAKIGDARIVVLGEATHSEGATSSAKVRLCMFLHERMGFDVLAWEAGVLDCFHLDRALRDPSVPLDRAKTEMMRGGWDAESEVHPLFEYARASWRTERPLEMAGFDGERPPYGAAHFMDLVRRFDAALEDFELDPDIEATLQTFADRAFGYLRVGTDPKPDDELRIAQRRTVESLLELLDGDEARRRWSRRDRELFRTVLSRGLTTEEWKYRRNFGPLEGVGKLRDRAMAKAFRELATHRFAGRKIMVWAATAHLTRNTETLVPIDRDWDYQNAEHMGDTVFADFGDDLYTIAVTSHHGETGLVRTGRPSRVSAVALPPGGSFEDLAHQVGEPYLFVDLRGETGTWLAGEFVARPLGFIPTRAVWSKVIDAFLFIDEMTPLHRR